MINTKSTNQKIFAELENEQDELNQLIQSLIQIRSYSCEEKEIVEFILHKMAEYNFDEAFSDKFGNVVGRIGNGPIKILFDAHIDTVKVTESEEWLYPPFEGKIVDGKIYGRGAVDEKPAMAGYLMAGKKIKKYFANESLPFTLYIVGSVLEEDADGYPLYHLIINEGIKPDYVLLGEPTDLKVYRGQRGRMEMKITTTGKSAHGAHNQQGINAVYKMNPIIDGIEKLDKSLPAVEPLGKGSITVSQVVTRAPSLCSVPDYCQIHIDRRLTLGESKESAVEQLQKIIQDKKMDAEISIPDYEAVSWKGTKFKEEAYFPTWVLEKDHVLTQAGLQTASNILSKSAELGTWAFSTNGVATAGHFDIPTIGFAPGKEELSHSSKEELLLDDLLLATKFYFALPFQLCELLNQG
ncbi:YgeY family selenium metabolism-linked hydrolase [candidate division KSB1 bacterium]|nr:YgeY family selenium metabolism-linked hydrolase [candidate division KSB1 bacterium]MBL7094228.1 YgeY family selenium metabolism-linked hydrolase [candidate division KSB1 bacterium]